MASGVPVNSECISMFQKLNLRQKVDGQQLKYIIYKIDGLEKEPGGSSKPLEIVVEKISSSPELEDLQLPNDNCRWAVYDYEYEHSDGGQRNKLLFIAWIGADSRIRDRMVYASSMEALRMSLGIATVYQATDEEHLTHIEILKKVKT